VTPTQAVGPGAKWRVTSKQKLGGAVEVTKVVTYELVGKKGNDWTLKGTTKVTGDEQTVQGQKIGAIGGDGAHEVTVTDGNLIPAFKQSFVTNFSITITPQPAEAGGAVGAPVVVKFWINLTNGIAPKA